MTIEDLCRNPAARSVLEERAQALASQDGDDGAATGEQILVFRLGDGTYGIPADAVHEVQPFSGYTPLPAVPAFVVGLVNIRGHLLTALDIRPLLDIPPAPPQAQSFLLRVAAGGMDVGLLADAVVEVRRGDLNLTPSLAAAAGCGVTWVRGVDRRQVVWIDPAQLLAEPRLIVNDAAD